MVYLDANATQPVRPEARVAMLAALGITGNPSSVHAAGRAARHVQENARDVLAARFGARPSEVVFTSGGTEANALAIHALSRNRRIIISTIEHDAVRAAAAGAVVLPVGSDGVADLDALAGLLRDGVPSLLCLMLANNETGVIQPVQRAAAICRGYGALLHVDAVQAAGRMPVSLPALGADSVAISAHKLGGAAGIGALLLASDLPVAPLIGGGGQERGRRGGTPSVPLAAGFAAAAAAAAGDDLPRLAKLRDRAEAAAVAVGAMVCGGSVSRLPNTTCLALPGVRADTQVIALDLAGIAVSAGAACSSGKVGASHVLAAMGLGPLAGQAIRVSLPWNVTPADIDAFADAYARMADQLSRGLVPNAA